MATKAQIAKIVQLRGLGYSLEEIAVEIGLSKSAVAYQLQKLKQESLRTKADEVFNAAILGGLVGAASGLAIAALIDIINKGK
jgi:predicted transcriptional regulator